MAARVVLRAHQARRGVDGIVPDAVRGRMDKMGFVTPEEEWLKGETGGDWDERLGKVPAGIFDIPAARKRIGAIRAGRVPFGFAPWRWLNFGAWWHACAGGGT